ncbi:MAG: hypothetical protein LUI60_07060 [Clostridia bacterium]|nr:hypothetical protein [Clostridia bacterium]
MKVIKKKFSAIFTMLAAILLSLIMVFATACSDDDEDETSSSSSSSSGVATTAQEDLSACDGNTIGTSGITFDESGYTANIITGTGTTYSVNDVSGFITAVKSAAAGDVIELAAGTYSIGSKQGTASDSAAVLISTSGSYDGYITIKAASGAEGKVIFDFSKLEFDSNNRGIQINGNYWYVYGICVTGAGDNGMYIGGSYNVIENCQFYGNRDTGLQLGRGSSGSSNISDWPSYNLIKNCTSYNNYDNQTYGENADGFAAKLTVGYGNVFDGCIAYRNSDDGWDLYAYASNGDIGAVIIYNCVAFENGYLMTTQEEFNKGVKLATNYDSLYAESDTNVYTTRDGDGNGFKLGGSSMRGNVKLYNCMSFSNRMHGVTDNSNPGVLNIEGVTSYNNGAGIDEDIYDTTNYGHVIAGASVDDEYGNINTARTEGSYNNYKNVLSVADSYRSKGTDAGLVADDFIGSAQNSIFYMGSGSYNYVGSAIDSSTYETGESKVGSSITALDSSAVFEKLPLTLDSTSTETAKDSDGNDIYCIYDEDGVASFVDTSGNAVTSSTSGAVVYTYTKEVQTENITGLENASIHTTYRNSDGSINMGDILAIKSDSVPASYGVGATLNKGSWDDYTHYYSVTVSSAGSTVDATLIAIYNTLYLSCNADAVYQDFTLTTAMTNATITWSSSNDSVIHIQKMYNAEDPSEPEKSSNSSSQDISAVVYRPETDTQVTLTAYITYNGKACKKTFEVTVKADAPAIGEVYAEDVENGRILVDQYQNYSEPEFVVTNAADYNGKTLADSTYTVETTYEYATSYTSTYSKVGSFTTSAAGVYRITKTVTLTSDGSQATYTYYIYVASNDATIDFTDGAGTIAVYQNGYILSGSMTNIKGTLYAYSTTKSLGSNATVEYITANFSDSIESCEFRDSSITAYFTNANTAAYYVYYWFANGNGVVTSDVHEKPIALVKISSTSDFEKAITENNAQTIYLLTTDLDFNGTYGVNVKSDTTWKGLFNGNGHTISNITSTNSSDEDFRRISVFGILDGGTIMNVRFKNIELTYSYTGKTSIGTGLIAVSYGGYIYKVAIENITVTSNDHAGGLIGAVRNSTSRSSTINTTYIDQVSITGSVTSTNGSAYVTRAGGLISEVTLNSGDGTEVAVEISNCYIGVDVTGLSYVGGAVGRFNDGTAGSTYSLEISNVYMTGDVVCTYNYTGGILGGQSGVEGSCNIDSCVFFGTMTFKGVQIKEAQKNASGIFGRYSQYADSSVSNCYATVSQYFDDYTEGVNTAVADTVVKVQSVWTRNVIFDVASDGSTVWTYVLASADSTNLTAPYIILTFLSDYGWDSAVLADASTILTNIG